MSFFARLCGCSSTPRTNETPSTTARYAWNPNNPHNITSGSANPDQVNTIHQTSTRHLQQTSTVTPSTTHVHPLQSIALSQIQQNNPERFSLIQNSLQMAHLI